MIGELLDSDIWMEEMIWIRLSFNDIVNYGELGVLGRKWDEFMSHGLYVIPYFRNKSSNGIRVGGLVINSKLVMGNHGFSIRPQMTG